MVHHPGDRSGHRQGGGIVVVGSSSLAILLAVLTQNALALGAAVTSIHTPSVIIDSRKLEVPVLFFIHIAQRNIVVAPGRVLRISSLVSYVLSFLSLGVVKPGVVSCLVILQHPRSTAQG